MGGIIILGILIIWFVISLELAGMLFNKLNPKRGRGFALVALSILVFIAPVADEIIGGFQFAVICNDAKSSASYDPNRIKGATLLSHKRTNKKPLTVIPITVSTLHWIDPLTKEELLTFSHVSAQGGFLRRAIGYPGGSGPIVFNGVCAFKAKQLFKQLNITTIFREQGEVQ